jgi:hypothetical protein
MESFDFNENTEEFAGQDKYRIVICGANSYDKKYYFNKKFDNLPSNIKEELNIICVLFTEECGGIFTISFTPFGHVEFDTRHEEGDFFYDEISARLLIKEIRRKLLFEQKVFTGVSGTHVIRLLPPLCLSKAEADEFLARFKKVLE